MVSELGKGMGPDLELDKSEEAALAKENVTVEVPALSESREQKVVLLQPGTDHKGIGFEQTPMPCGDVEDVQVNIIENGGMSSGCKGVEGACEDLTDTECSGSSSFGDTGSVLETASGSAFSDSEVESPMCDDDWSEHRLRKKKVTVHWRRFTSPLTWRCKWIELQLKNLNSQSMKYEKELAAYDYKKQLEFLKFAVDGFDVKSVPISDGIQRNKVMKRKKRKRAEECNLSSYVSNHSIFSYYENKKHSHDASLEDFCGDAMKCNVDNTITEEFKLNDMWSFVDHEDNDKSFIHIIQKVDELMSQVEKLKTRIDNVISENRGKCCSLTQLSIIGPSDGFNHPGHNSASLAGMTPFIETANRTQLEVPQGNTKDEVLIQNQAAKEELHDFENVRNHLVEQQSISPVQVSESDLVAENVAPNVRSTLKACSTSKPNFLRNTRNGRKKSGLKS